MLRKKGKIGFTLIELLVVISIIGILAAIAIPIYRIHIIKAKLTEVTSSMSAVAFGLVKYYHEERQFPGAMSSIALIDTSLGVSIPEAARSRIQAVATTANGAITFTITKVDSVVDNSTLILTPTTSALSPAITWAWSGTVPAIYIPMK